MSDTNIPVNYLPGEYAAPSVWKRLVAAEARVARLEAALREAKRYLWLCDEWRLHPSPSTSEAEAAQSIVLHNAIAAAALGDEPQQATPFVRHRSRWDHL